MKHSEKISGIARELLGNIGGLERDPKAFRRFKKTHRRTQDAHERGWDGGHYNYPNAPRDKRMKHSSLISQLDIEDATAAFETGGIEGLNNIFPPCTRSAVIFDARVDAQDPQGTDHDFPLQTSFGS